MNKLLILAKNANTFFIERIKEEATQAGVSWEIINPWANGGSPSQTSSFLVRCTSIHGDNQDLDFIKKFDLKTQPNIHALEALRTKPSQFQYFAVHNIPHLPWLDLKACTRHEITDFCHQQDKLLIKPQRGQGGWGIQVFSNVRELLGWWDESEDREYLLQPYLEENVEERIFFMGETYIALRRIKKGVAANFRQEGEAQLISVPQALKEIVDHIKKDFNLLYGAADFLTTPEGASYLLEMNLVPGIEQLEAVSGQNVAKELLAIFLNP